MSEVVRRAEPLVGPARIACNQAHTSIHDDGAARRLGFRGSAVAGSVHLDVFAPLLVETYGPAWFERGALSVYFHNVVVSGEPVQAVAEPPAAPGAQVQVRARRADAPDFLVCEGTASLGDHARSAIASRDLRLCDNAGLRLLRGVEPGKPLGSVELVAARSAQDEQIAAGLINESMPWFQDASPWGAPIASVSTTALLMFRLLGGQGGENQHWRISPHLGEAFGMFGAFEVAYEAGPVFLDRPYRVEGRVVGVGESPKTEYLWWDATCRDERGAQVARMRHLLRFLKSSSPLYPELGSG